MNRMRTCKYLIVTALISGITILSPVSANTSSSVSGKAVFPQLFGKGEPKAARKARKKQEAKERKQDKEYGNFVKNNQKRSIEIQTPEVQARMKQNVKDANARYKARKKTNASRSKKTGRKYN
jgi:hypothetical protein